jgi:hypothetical protein
VKVGKVGGTQQGREHLHRGLLFRIGHQRQIDQALDRAAIEGLPDRFVFDLDLIPGRMFRDVNAEQAQARQRASHGLRVLRLDGVEQDLQMVDGGLVDFRRPALQQLHN